MKANAAAFLGIVLWCCAGHYAGAASKLPSNFLYTGHGDLPLLTQTLKRADIEGVQVVYSWKRLETGKDRYDFSPIEADLALLAPLHKKLFIQVQDRFFEADAKHYPAYLLQDPAYQGGIVAQSDHPGDTGEIGQGWVAQQWNPQVRRRFQLLLKALAKQFDGRIYGINLPESAIDIDMKRDTTHFTCDRYFKATLENAATARRAFTQSHVVQYVNFWPCEWNNDRRFMSRLFDFAVSKGIGLGGPDIVPFKPAQMANSYRFFHARRGKLALVAMAVQEPTLTYVDPHTGKPFTKEAFQQFAADYLGADIIFWSPAAPWLKQPESVPQ